MLAILVAAQLAVAQPPVEIGPLRLTIHESRTAQVFHIVDQLAEWDARTHRSYVRWAADSLQLDSLDRALLERHALLRRAHGWNRGFEQTFYSSDELVLILRRQKALPPPEAREEAAILEHFARRLAPMLDGAAPRLHAFAERLPLVRDSLEAALAGVFRLSGVTRRIDVPVYLVPNPVSGTRGGRFAARSVILEVPVTPDAMISLEHELFHVLMAPHEKQVRATAKAGAMDFDIFNEALAYAFAPGLTSVGDDFLQRQSDAAAVGSDARNIYKVALLLRPLLRDAIERDEPLSLFLSHAGALLRGSALF